MREWLVFATQYATMIVNAMALIVIAIGTIETFLRGLGGLFRPSTTGRELRDAYLRYARWLIAGLTFQLAADILATATGASWDEIGRLSAIAVIRTFLNFFLERDIAESRNLETPRKIDSPSLN
jgi:uncharacterized membrane protein